MYVCSRGISTETDEAFREYFSKAGDIRARLPKVPLMSLTATASQTTLLKLQELLGLHDARIYRESPDRQNIKLTIQRAKVQGPQCLQWLVNLLKQNGKDCKKIIVFCRRLHDCSSVYSFISGNLRNMQDGRSLYNMVHSKTPERVKGKIIDSLMDPYSCPRVVIATKVLGLGIDAKCDMVVHYGPPCSTEDYLQQSGRAGRMGEEAEAVMIYSGRQMRNVQASMLNVIHRSSSHCIRATVLEDFGFVPQNIYPGHLCFTYCATKCLCGTCEDVGTTLYETDSVEATSAPISVRSVPSEIRRQPHVNLIRLKEKLDAEVILTNPTYTKPELIHGLSMYIITHIVGAADKVGSVDDLLDFGHLVCSTTASRVCDVFPDVFEDMDVDLLDNVCDDTDM